MFIKQPMMRRVVYALVPIYLFALYLYGLQLVILSLIVFPAGILIEYIMEKRNKKEISEAIWVTCFLFLLSLPPRTPWWVALIGIAFGVLFAKEVFGGFGRNPFNPAIAGRLFIYLTFPAHMTYDWSTIGNFGMHADAVTSATSIGILKQGGYIDILQHILGLRTGSFGESAVILILAAAIYLIMTKTASWEIMLSTIGSAFLLNFILDIFHVPGTISTIPSILTGSIIFASVFIATDPVSAPKKIIPKWIFGIIIGSATILIRTFSLFPEGTSFGVLLGNTFASLLDEIFTKKKVEL
jgi:Na+-transporting NADH:ubiquinone oxidoreductase subunit B